MDKPTIIIITGNSLKFNELSLELSKSFNCEQRTLDNYYEIQGTPEEIIHHKLLASYEAFKKPVICDDTSVHFEELGGFPGPYIKDFIRHIPIYEMGMKFAGSRIQIACRLGFYDGENEPIISLGEINGDVITPKNIDPGVREFDLFVQIDGTNKPMIDLTLQEKNEYSHRGKAMQNLLEKLKSIYD